MANELLDFVMAVVRDPDAAARFAANPDQAILDAHLTDVSVADVNALIPVVSESLSALPTAVPTAGLDDGIAEAANVWSSGAATAAFDAFGDHAPATAFGDPAFGDPVFGDPALDIPAISDPGADVPSVADAPPVLDEPVVDAVIEDIPQIADPGDAADRIAEIEQLDVDAGGFDVFD